MKARYVLYHILLVFGVASTGMARPGGGSAGYLARIGPVPLRFQPAPPAKPIALPPLPVTPPPPSEPEIKSEPPSTGVNEPAGHSPDQFPNPSPIWDPSDQSSSPETLLPGPVEQSVRSGASAPAATELLPVNPQMMIEYFRPVAGSTNGAGVSAYVPLYFNPATPATVPPSRATYKSQ